jgi:hypothetical protein
VAEFGEKIGIISGAEAPTFTDFWQETSLNVMDNADVTASGVKK